MKLTERIDRYIVKNIVSRKYTIYTPKQYDRFKDRHILTYLDIKNSCKEVYGAIWTDTGLKYIAKMNEKGELELLWQVKKR